MAHRVLHSRRLIISLVALLGAVSFLFASPAGAAQDDSGDCYPDGCGSTTTTEAPEGPSCGIELEAGVAGATIEAVVHMVPPGGEVRILLDGREVARGTNESGVQSIVAMPMQEPADVAMTFAVPDLPPGEYSLVAVGVGFTVTCGGGGFDVLADAASAGGGGGGGALAFTGAEIAGLVVLALVLLAVGYVLVRRSRRRRLA